MDENKITLLPQDAQPCVRLANYFSLRAGCMSSWADRVIEDIELILVVDGRFEFFNNSGDRYVLRAGHVLLIWPMEFHTFRRQPGSENGTISCIHCEMTSGKRFALKEYSLDPMPPRVTDVTGNRELHDHFKQAAKVFEGYGRLRDSLLSTLVRSIWLMLAQYWLGSRQASVFSERMEQMLAFLRERLCQRVTRCDLAEEFAVTPEHVNYLFKKELGLTPTQFVHRERILQAYRLLHEGSMSVKEAAREVGFSDPFHFSRVFKRVLGIPPSQA